MNLRTSSASPSVSRPSPDGGRQFTVNKHRVEVFEKRDRVEMTIDGVRVGGTITRDAGAYFSTLLPHVTFRSLRDLARAVIRQFPDTFPPPSTKTFSVMGRPVVVKEAGGRVELTIAGKKVAGTKREARGYVTPALPHALFAKVQDLAKAIIQAYPSDYPRPRPVQSAS